MHALWRVSAVHAIEKLAPTGVIELACEDTLFHHEGRRVEGADVFRDAVRSTIVNHERYRLGFVLLSEPLLCGTHDLPYLPRAAPSRTRVHESGNGLKTILDTLAYAA